jgi:cytidylate kinase
MKHTYKITFEKECFNQTRFEWNEISSSSLYRLVATYCLKKEIRIKKFDIKDCFHTSILKVKCGTKEYQNLLFELSKPEYKINLLKIKV